MESIANMVIAVADLAEAEGRAVHRGAIRLTVRLVAILGAGVLGVLGLLLVASGVYLALVHWFGEIWASLICGALLLGGAAALFLYGRIPPKRPQQSRNFPLDETGAAGAHTQHNDKKTSPGYEARDEEGLNHDEPLRSRASI